MSPNGKNAKFYSAINLMLVHNLSVSRRRELAQPLASHFIRIWGLPPKSDSDLVLCAIYSRATMDQVEVHERRAKRTNHADVEILDE